MVPVVGVGRQALGAARAGEGDVLETSRMFDERGEAVELVRDDAVVALASILPLAVGDDEAA